MRKEILIVGSLLAASGALLLLFITFHDRLLGLVGQLVEFVRSLSFAGNVLMILLIALSCFPPLVGYSTLLTLCGFIYADFGAAFATAYAGGLLGAMASFFASRKLFSEAFKERMLSVYPNFIAIDRAITEQGIHLSHLKTPVARSSTLDHHPSRSISIWTDEHTLVNNLCFIL